MKKLKDFLYDKNDILIALVILIVAGLLIVWRIDSIMKYPDTLISETSTDNTTEESAIDEKDKSKDESKKDKEENSSQDNSSNSEAENTPAGVYSNGTLTGDITVTVAGGSVTGAVDSLIAVGLFDSYADFETACANAGVSPDSIKAATFTFAAGSTKADIAAKVTQ